MVPTDLAGRMTDEKAEFRGGWQIECRPVLRRSYSFAASIYARLTAGSAASIL
jgi:hypothetical protein